jgi:predicted Co/Zn/Cd cation transporter (cation efflux family)
MRHALLLFVRILLLVIALYAVSNALKELLLREDEVLDTTMLILFNVLIAALCWSLGCWKSQRAGREAPSSLR